ncbi:ABC transporter substrate-binding protein [Devosia rhizoryzae]|uniref:ABC transporter substrate-binding protein n=1 Tax=Devosia rhizoryzae TaxID=2774137 RepID=A0ABX7C2Q4_9HYPH|nr:ABC transporter substrate-binding protein [Devosia rhizoryzae]QQR38525.1 ABC transporter substrate-binding protein [Devosia rhizoryzae]
MQKTMTGLLRGTATMLTAAAIGLASAGNALAQPADVLELKLALAVADTQFNTTTSSIFQLAEQFGFYEKHGVKVTIVPLEGTPQAVAALNAGAVDIADISIDSALRLRAENDLPIRGFVAVARGTPFLIAAKSEIATVEDLAGRSYAIADNGSLDHTLTQAVLRSYGVEATGPDFVAIGAPDVRIQALAAGRIDATTVSYGTFLSIDNPPGIHVLVDPDDFSSRAPALSKFVAALDSTIETKNEALQRFTTALIDASRSMATEPERWVAAITEGRPDLSPENIKLTSDLVQTRWCVNGCVNPAELSKAVDFTYEGPDFADVKVISAQDISDQSFATKAIEELGAFEGETIDIR